MAAFNAAVGGPGRDLDHERSFQLGLKLYVLALTTDMRQGELLGLKWSDLDLDAGTVHIKRTLGRVRQGGWVESEPKSAKGRRSIAVAPLAVQALRQHRSCQLEERLALGALWEDRGLVFPNLIGRPIEPQNLLRRSFWPLLQRAELPRLRFHDLRHRAATLLLSLGTHPKIVQELLGHSRSSLNSIPTATCCLACSGKP